MKFWKIEDVEKKIEKAKAKNQIVLQDLKKEKRYIDRMHSYGFKLAYDYVMTKKMEKHERRFNRLLRNMTGLKIASMRGKMKNMFSISTNACLNSKCQDRIMNALARQEIEPGYDNICLHCYAITFLSGNNDISKGAFKNQSINYDILTNGFLHWDCIPVWFEKEYFRFESHGDLQNATQLINYVAICEKSMVYGSKTRFALWTKNQDILYNVFIEKGIHKPANLQILVSSEELNKVCKVMPGLENIVNKVFTVYNPDTYDVDNVDFNCCDYRNKSLTKERKCHDCHICYDSNDVTNVNECLKPGT